MGVRGLSSYVMSCQRACCEYVELSAGGSVDVDVQAEETVRLAVDGMALVYHVMRSPGEHELHLELGCDYLALFEAFRDYLVALRDAGIVPYVIVDGMQDGGKESTTLERRRVQAAKACEIMDSIGLEHWTASAHSQRPSLLPLFAVETLAAACHSAGIYIRVAHREADPELAAACRSPRPKHASNFPTNSPRGGEDDSEGVKREHFQSAKETRHHLRKSAERTSPEHDGTEAAEGVRSKQSVDVADGVGFATERMGDGSGGVSQSMGVCTERGDDHDGWGLGCVAVLSNDSDFMVMDIPGYIPFWSLGIGEDGSAGALVFRRRLLAVKPIFAHLFQRDSGSQRMDWQILYAFWGMTGYGPMSVFREIYRFLQSSAKRKLDEFSMAGFDPCNLRAILEEDRLNSQGKGVGNGRRKKGKSAVKSTMHSSAPSAKELVEATGRFLSRFYRSREALQRRSDLNAEGVGPRRDSAALLCSRFFPGLEGDSSGENMSTPPVDILEEEEEVVGSKPSGEHRPLADDSPALDIKRKFHRKKGSKGKGKGAGNSRKRGQPPPAVDAKNEDRAPSNERGLAFLRDFKTARRHYEVPYPYRQPPVRGAFSEDVSPFEHRSGTPLSAASGGGGLACPVGLRVGVSVPSAVTQAVLEGVFWCRVMLEDTPASSATAPRPSISPANSSKTPESPLTFGESSCAFGRLEGVRKRIYEVYLEAIALECPDLVVSASGKIRAEQEIGNTFDEGHTKCWPKGGGLGLGGGDDWVVTEFRRVRENIRPFQVACRVSTSKGNKGLSGHIDDIGRWRTCLSVLGIEEGDVGHRLAERITAWLSGNGVASVDASDARPSSGSISPALVGITLVAVLLLSTLSDQPNADTNSIGSRCLEACLEADIVLAFIATATRPTESFFDKGMGEGALGEIGEEVREFVGLWSRVQTAAWHVNTCLGVLGLLGTGRDGLGYCTALNPLRLRPAFALEVFLWRRKCRKMNYLCVVGERRCRHFPSKIHGHESEDQLREDRSCPCPWDKGGRGRYAMGRREAYCCCWWYSMTERCRGDCNWASRMEIVLGAVSA